MQKEDTAMAVTATETSWLSPEMQGAAVAALQILKNFSSEDQSNMLLGIVGFRQGNKQGEGDVYVDARQALITDSPGDDCVRIGRLSYKISKEYDVEEGLYKILCTAMMHLEGNHPIRSHKGGICYTSSSVSYIYQGELNRIRHAYLIVGDLVSNAVHDVLWDLHEQLLL